MRTISSVLCAILGLTTAASSGCGGKKGDESPAALCQKIYEERISGAVIMFKEQGPEHKDEFLAYCEKQPVDYLKCEAEDLAEMSEKRMESCGKLIRRHQKAFNLVLTTGKPTEAAETEKKPESKAEPIPADLPSKATRGDDICSKVCGKSVDVEYEMAKVMLKSKPAKLKKETELEVKKEAECNRRCNNHLAAGGAHKELVEKIAADCADKKDFVHAECIGKINVEWRKKHTEGKNAIQWGYDEPCNGKWNGCDEGE